MENITKTNIPLQVEIKILNLGGIRGLGHGEDIVYSRSSAEDH